MSKKRMKRRREEEEKRRKRRRSWSTWPPLPPPAGGTYPPYWAGVHSFGLAGAWRQGGQGMEGREVRKRQKGVRPDKYEEVKRH